MCPRFVKTILTSLVYRPGTSHRILFGPLWGMRFRYSESTGLSAIYSGNERPNQRLAKSILKRGDTVVDAGANWGMHTLHYARLVGPEGKVYAFEPHPVARQELAWHVAANCLTQVKINDIGLLDKCASLELILGESSKTSTFRKRVESGHGVESVMVPVRSLDSVAAEACLSKIRLIKIDVEGAESQVLAGAASTIASCRPDLIVELHTPEQDLEVARLLSGWDYRLFRLEGPAIRYLDQPWPHPNGVWGTVHAVPREHSTRN